VTLWIDTPDLLRARLQRWQGQTLVALDTEFIRERTYYPQLALVQLAIRDEALLIDPLVPGMADALRPLLLDPAIVKLMHSASEDLQALLRGASAVPAPLFDTQVAAAMCGLGAGLSYQKLVEQVTGTQLEKGETRSDWLRRPLSESQLKYAADDVLHLHEIHDVLSAKLQELGREDWLRQDNERSVNNARNDVDDPLPHLSLRSAERLDADAQARLCRLLRWRDAQARAWDRPKSWVLDNELAVALSRRVPADYNEFSGTLDRHPKAPRKARAELWAIVSAPLTDNERAIPPIRASETLDKQKLRALQDTVARLAAGLEIPDGLLCARKHLETLMEGRGWPAALEGWRRQLLEPALAPLLL
jgi:ribonuclease D